jgi:hypothetical protein
MIIVDYPPGGLGNFAAQVITDTVFNCGHPSFHENHKAYDIQLVQKTQADFLDCLAQWQPEYPVAICHSYGNTTEIKNRVDCRIISIQPVNNWLQLWVNKELKAVPKNAVQTTQSYEWYYHALSGFKNMWEDLTVDELVNFDNFYLGPEEFYHNIQQLNPAADAEYIYDIFVNTQQPILDRMAKLKQLAESDQDITQLPCFDQAVINLIRKHSRSATTDPD